MRTPRLLVCAPQHGMQNCYDGVRQITFQASANGSVAWPTNWRGSGDDHSMVVNGIGFHCRHVDMGSDTQLPASGRRSGTNSERYVQVKGSWAHHSFRGPDCRQAPAQ